MWSKNVKNALRKKNKQIGIFQKMNQKTRKSKKAFIVGIGCNDLSSTSSQVAESVYQIYEYMMKNNY